MKQILLLIVGNLTYCRLPTISVERRRDKTTHIVRNIKSNTALSYVTHLYPLFVNKSASLISELKEKINNISHEYHETDFILKQLDICVKIINNEELYKILDSIILINLQHKYQRDFKKMN